jgi:transposase
MLSKQDMSKRAQMGFFALEDLDPQDHLLRQIDQLIDFSFIYDLVKDKYDEVQGRPSLDPVLLIKLPMIQYLFGIKSMRQTIKEIEVNNAYRWFLGLGLEMLFLISLHLVKTIQVVSREPLCSRNLLWDFDSMHV